MLPEQTDEYDKTEEFNVDSKAECNQLNLAHVATLYEINYWQVNHLQWFTHKQLMNHKAAAMIGINTRPDTWPFWPLTNKQTQ